MNNFVILNNGVKMPMIGYGTVGLKGEDGIKTILSAIDCGYRMIDTARMYGNEADVGEAVRRCGISRSELFITTKLNEPCNSYGKARAIGVSSFNERKLNPILENCSVIPAVNQIESHVYYPELELKEYLKSKNIQTEAWAPFGGGNVKISEEPVLIKLGSKI